MISYHIYDMYVLYVFTCFQVFSRVFKVFFKCFFGGGGGAGPAIGTMGGGVGGMCTPPGPPLALRNLTCVAHDIANGLKVARATELTSVTPLAAQGGGAARDFENTLKTRETYLKTYWKHIIYTWKSMIYHTFISVSCHNFIISLHCAKKIGETPTGENIGKDRGTEKYTKVRYKYEINDIRLIFHTMLTLFVRR